MSHDVSTGDHSERAGKEPTTPELVRLHRTVAVIAEALERRRRKVAAGLPVDPPPACPCEKCQAAGGSQSSSAV